jgi:Mycothiol maleylpyruvate isomerase N-terminal domain
MLIEEKAFRTPTRSWEAAVTVVDDYVAESIRLEGILGLLTEAQWLAPSGADGWSVADVVLHLAQSDEGVVASVGGASPRDRDGSRTPAGPCARRAAG